MAVPFSEADKWALISLIDDNRDIIENKKTDIHSNSFDFRTFSAARKRNKTFFSASYSPSYFMNASMG